MREKFLPGCRSFIRDTSLILWFIFALIVGLALWTQSLPAESEIARHLASEQGIFEQSQAGFLFAAAMLALVSCIVRRSSCWLAAFVVIMYAGLREMDLQTRFTYRSIMSLGYYTRDIAPLSEKLLVILLISPCLLAIAYLIHVARRDNWLTGPKGGPRRAWTIWIAIYFMMSHITDRHPDWVWFIPGRIGTLEAVVETGLALAVLFVVAELKPRSLFSVYEEADSRSEPPDPDPPDSDGG